MVTSQWASTKCFLTWKVKATPQGRLLFQLAPSMRHTEETGSSLLPKMFPTPTVQDSNKATKKWRENHQNNLTAAVFNPDKLWPTPDTRGFTNKGSLEMLSKKAATKEEFDGMAF